MAPGPIIRRYDAAAIAAAAALIRDGGIVAVATETVYGLAADARRAEAVAQIYAAKGRPSFNPLIVHVADFAEAAAIATFDGDARILAERFWPGPLTLVLPLRPSAGIAGLVTAGLDTVAIRVPSHRAIRDLLRESGRALAAPSANASNGLSPTRAEHVAGSLGGRVPLIVDDGPCPAGIESTIVRGHAILRAGPITAAMLSETLGGALAPRPADRQDAPDAPGQLATHYAPRKPLRLHAAARNGDEYLLGFGEVAGDETLSARGDAVEAAAALFDALHRADAATPSRIAVAPIPEDGIGAAINDRLRRAATR